MISKMDNIKYLLDTNTLIDFMDGIPSVVDNVLKVGTRQCCISVISLHELFFGAYLAREKKTEYFENEIKKINKLIEYFAVLPLADSSNRYGYIKYALRKKGKTVDDFDLIIAAQAYNEGLIVVTDNMKHFEDIPDIKAENWMTHSIQQ